MLLAAASGTHAGSPGGLQLLTLPTARALPYQATIASFFSRVGHDAGASDCENAMLSVDTVYDKKARVGNTGIDSQFALEAVFSKSRRRQLAAALNKFRDRDIKRGFDAALVYDVVGNDVVFYGVSAHAGERVFTARVRVAETSDKAKVNAALCHVLVNLPVLVAP